MIWLTVMEYLFNKNPRICFAYRNPNTVLSSFMTFHRVSNKSHTKEQELFSLPEHIGSPPVVRLLVARSLVFYEMFCWSLCVPLFFPFGHSLVCPSSIYSFWLLLWYFQTLLLPWYNARWKRLTDALCLLMYIDCQSWSQVSNIQWQTMVDFLFFIDVIFHICKLFLYRNNWGKWESNRQEVSYFLFNSILALFEFLILYYYECWFVRGTYENMNSH